MDHQGVCKRAVKAMVVLDAGLLFVREELVCDPDLPEPGAVAELRGLRLLIRGHDPHLGLGLGLGLGLLIRGHDPHLRFAADRLARDALRFLDDEGLLACGVTRGGGDSLERPFVEHVRPVEHHRLGPGLVLQLGLGSGSGLGLGLGLGLVLHGVDKLLELAI